MNVFETWAAMWGVPAAAVIDLRERMAIAYGPEGGLFAEESEAASQAQARLAAKAAGFTLFRNNVGALKDERGIPVRYGLANDSAALNRSIKSGDLIGWKSVLVTPEMVGSTIAQFASCEVKRAGWVFRGDKHEQAQQRWANLVNANGGVAFFSTGGFPK